MNRVDSLYTFRSTYPRESREEVIKHLNALVQVARRLKKKYSCSFRFGVQSIRLFNQGVPSYQIPKSLGGKLSYPIEDEDVEYYSIRVLIFGEGASSCCDRLIKRAGHGRKTHIDIEEFKELDNEISCKSVQRRNV